jgi:hypothetical protein
MKKIGNREEVWNGLAQMTSGKLEKKDLMISPKNKIVSIKQYNQAKRNYPKMVEKLCSKQNKTIKKEIDMEPRITNISLHKKEQSPFTTRTNKFDVNFAYEQLGVLADKKRMLEYKLERTNKTSRKYNEILEAIKEVDELAKAIHN